jgi:hypothetical protein
MAQATSNLLQQYTNPAPTALSILNTPSPAQTALTNKINNQPTALKTTTPSWQSTMNTVQSNYNANPIKAAPLPLNTGTNNMTQIPTVNPNQQFNNVSGGAAGTPVVTNQNLYGSGNSQNQQQNTQNNQNSNQQSNQNQQQNNQDQITYAGLIAQLQKQASQPSQSYQDALAQAQQYNQQLGESKANEAAALSANAQNPIPLEFQQGRGQILQNQYLAQQNALAGQYQGATNLLGAANTQQGLQQSGLTSAISASAPQQYGLTTQPYNPLTNTIGGANGASAVDRAINAGNINTAQTFAQDYQTGLANLRTADAIQNQIISTLSSNPTLNNTPISAFTDIARFFAGQSSEPSQQVLAQQVNNYIKTLGLDPSAVATVASQSKGTLAELLESLRATAQAQVEAKNPTNLQTNQNTPTSGANPWH